MTDSTSRESWATTLEPMSFDDRLCTFAEDGSTLGEFVLETKALEDAARELLAALDRRFPKGQSKQLPGISLFQAMEAVRKVLDEGVEMQWDRENERFVIA